MSNKRTTKKERDYPARPTDKTSTISIDPSLVGRFRRIGRNPLDEEFAAEDDMLARELKTMRVDEIVLRRRAKIAKLQKDIDELEKDKEKTTGQSITTGMSLPMLAQISQMPEEEQQKVLQTYALFKSVDQIQGRRDPLLPLLVGFSRTNPGSSRNDMAQYAKAMSDQFKTGVEVMKTVMPPQDKPSSGIELIKAFSSLLEKSVTKPMDELVKRLQPQPSAFEQILMNPELFGRAKEMGMFGGKETKTAGSTNIDLEIEKLRGEREMSIKKMDLEWRKSMLEMEARDNRTTAIVNALTPMSALFAGPVEQRMRNLGRHTAGNPQQVNVSQQQVGQPPVPDNVLQILCKQCGYSETRTLQGAPPERLPCPGCGAELVVGGPPSGIP